jgi:hypothetical protein
MLLIMANCCALKGEAEACAPAVNYANWTARGLVRKHVFTSRCESLEYGKAEARAFRAFSAAG